MSILHAIHVRESINDTWTDKEEEPELEPKTKQTNVQCKQNKYKCDQKWKKTKEKESKKATDISHTKGCTVKIESIMEISWAYLIPIHSTHTHHTRSFILPLNATCKFSISSSNVLSCCLFSLSIQKTYISDTVDYMREYITILLCVICIEMCT